MFKLYTDGACSGNPGKGGYGAIILSEKGDVLAQISGHAANTTNNRMEMMAVIKGLEEISTGSSITVYSDSRNVVAPFNEHWLENWVQNGWRTANKKPVKNQDLWLRLKKLVEDRKVTFIQVKGHADDYYNNKCDQIAVNEYLNMKE